MADNGDWILKIISGPHQGVEEMLPEGRLVVGTGPDCGIVLHDVLIAAQHFALTRKGAVVTVEALEGRAYCQGRRVTSATTVPAFGFVTAGTTHFVLGPAAVRWPLISPADAPELEKDPPPPAAVPAAASPAPAIPAVATPTPPAADGKAKDAPAVATTPAAPTPEQRRRAWWMVGFGGALLVVWMILWFLLRPAPMEPARPGPKVRTERVLGSVPGGNRLRLEERGDQLLVSGYLDSDTAHRDLIAALRAEVPEATLRLWSTPRLVETARAFLATRKLNLTLTPVENGELRIAGTAPTAPEWVVARQMLLAEVPGLQRIIDEVTFPRETTKGAKPSADSLVAPDKTFTVVALQTLPEAPAWVRLANGAVYFAGGRFQGIATFTGLEGAQARFEHSGGSSLFGLGDDLATLLPTPANKPRPARLEPAPAPAAQQMPTKPAVANPPPAPASTVPAPPTTASQRATTTTQARPLQPTSAPIATAPVAAVLTPGASEPTRAPAPAATAPEAVAAAETRPAAAPEPVIASAPAPAIPVETPAPAAAPTTPVEPPPVQVATAPAPAAPTSGPSEPAPAPLLPGPAATTGTEPAAAPPVASATAPENPVAPPAQSVEPTTAPVAATPAPIPSEPGPVPASVSTVASVPAPEVTPAATDKPAALPLRPSVPGESTTDAKIRLISEVLQARDAGNLAVAERAVSELARLIPNDPAVARLGADLASRAAAQLPVRPDPAAETTPSTPGTSARATMDESQHPSGDSARATAEATSTTTGSPI